jgi:FMN-dependent NADH-azoreductase
MNATNNPPANRTPLQILRVDSSARRDGSVTRRLADKLVERLTADGGETRVQSRDLAYAAPPLVDAAWVDANFTPPEQRSEAQRAALAESDRLVAELQNADVLVIGLPVYNFGIPASLKAWVDMVARARLTFRYTENGPVGLLQGKRAYLVVASGGTAVGGELDFATGYLRHVLGFLGIEDVEIVAADRTAPRGEQATIDAALKRIAQLLPADTPLAATA